MVMPFELLLLSCCSSGRVTIDVPTVGWVVSTVGAAGVNSGVKTG